MKNLTELREYVAGVEEKVATLSESIEIAENGWNTWSDAIPLLEQRDDLRSETYENLAAIILDDENRQTVWVAALTIEDAINDEPSIYIHHSFEGLIARVAENWDIDLSEVENIHTDVPEHFLRHGYNLTIEEQEIAA